MLVHILDIDTWERVRSTASHAPPSLASEGFIHLSRPDQVLVPANRFYAGRTDLVLLFIDEDRLPDALIWEDTVGEGQAFPHLYAPLPVAAVVGTASFTPDPDGVFRRVPRLDGPRRKGA